LQLAELVSDAGIAAEQLFSGLGVDRARLAIPGAQISLVMAEALFERARALTREPAIGIHLGLRMRPSAHGVLGFAAMTASTLREALETAARFAPTRTNALALSVHVSGGAASVVIEERAEFGAARDAILFWIVLGIWQMGNALTGRMLAGSADFAFERPAYFDAFVESAPNTRFAQPVTQLVFDAKVLDLPLTMADPASRQLAYLECERSLEELETGGDDLAQARKLVMRSGKGVRSLEEVAAELGVSPRTLKRRLAAAGVTYSALLEEERREVALLMLRSRASTIDAVAERLGYSDTSNFRRAFQRWTGLSPAAYRKGRGG
ncbi:MAG: AraC family transcriptional regulator ligand-binding domain-containing protein, partial [Polyangiaceae bacterium]